VKLVKRIHGAIRTNPALGRIALAAIPDLHWSVTVRDIGPMNIRLRRNRSYWLRDPLVHETFMVGAMRRLIRPGDVVFDAGANIGLYVRLAIQRFGAGRVIAFEPASQNQALLNRNIDLGNCRDKVEVVTKALADYDGTDEFQIDDVSTASGALNVITRGGASEARRQYGLPPVSETVTVARLDSLLQSGKVPVPDVIKIDVEGAEERLLRGAERTLLDHNPRLAIELHGREVSRAVVRFLLQIGYSVFGFLSTDKGRIYKEILASDIDEITGPYSLHHCIAGRERELMRPPIDLQL
jgi:FkbM family methyltransferase